MVDAFCIDPSTAIPLPLKPQPQVEGAIYIDPETIKALSPYGLNPELWMLATLTCLRCQSHGLGFRVQGLGFRVQGLGFSRRVHLQLWVFATRVFVLSCVKDFYIPPLLKTLAGVVFKRRQRRQVMERLESASTKNFLTNAEMVYHFRRAFWCCLGGWRGWVGGGNYVTWKRHMTIVPLK